MERRKNIQAREAVEDALQRRDIDDLTNKMEAGFKGVHARQDDANHATAKNVEAIGEIKQWQSFIKGGLAILTILVIPIIIYLLTHWR